MIPFTTLCVGIMACILVSAIVAGVIFMVYSIGTKDAGDFNVGFNSLGLAVFLLAFFVGFVFSILTLIVALLIRWCSYAWGTG